MKLFLLLFLTCSLYAYDYSRVYSDDVSHVEELQKISEINYDLSIFKINSEMDAELKRQLEEQRKQYIENFLKRILHGEVPEFDLKKLQLEMNRAKKNMERYSNTDSNFSVDVAISYMTDKLRITSLNLDISFVRFTQAIKQAIENFDSDHSFEVLYANFQQSLSIEEHSFTMVYKDSMALGIEKTAIMEKYVHQYNSFRSKVGVYTQIYVYIKQYVDNLVSTDSFVDAFDLEYIMRIVNKHYQESVYGVWVKHYFAITIGQLVAVLLIVIIMVLLYHLYFRVLGRVLHFIFCKQQKGDEQKNEKCKLDTFLEFNKASTSKPIMFLFILFSIDMIQRVLFALSEVNLGLVYYFEAAYAVILVWALFRMLDQSVFFYGDNFLQTNPSLRRELINFLLVIAKFVTAIIALLLILENYGVNISSLLASLGIGGLAIALAARESLSNLFGSIELIMDNTFSQGEWIVTDKYQGTVVEIGLRTTKIRTFDNALVFAPNSYLANAEIKNWNKRKVGRRIKFDVGVCYSSKMDDILKAVEEIRQMLREHPDIADDSLQYEYSKEKRAKIIERDDEYGIKKTLLVFMNRFDASSINIMVYCFSKTVDWAEWLSVQQDVMAKTAAIIENNGMSFAFPSQSVYVESLPDIQANSQIESTLKAHKGLPS